MPTAVAPAVVPLVIGAAGPSEAGNGFSSSRVAIGPIGSFMHEVHAALSYMLLIAYSI